MLQSSVLRSVRHRGLKRLIERGDARGVRSVHRLRIENIVTMLNEARAPADLDVPGFRPHRLRCNLKGFWSVDVSGNWRVVFRFEDGDVYDVDLLDDY